MTKPALSRLLCAAAALADVTAGELAARTGLTSAKVSQLRSGVRGDIADAQQLLEALQIRSEALIKHLGSLSDWGGRDVEETLAALLLCFDPEPPPLHTAPAEIVCDRLSLTLMPKSASYRLVDEFFDEAKPTPREGRYKRAGTLHGVFLGDGLRWRGWTGVRVDLNPAHIRKPARRFLRKLFHGSDDLQLTRVDVAVDLPVQIRAVQAIGTNSRKSSSVGSHALETIYIGAKNSALSFAIYDKQAELARRGMLIGDRTRFEARRKKLRIAPLNLESLENPFQALQLLWLGGDDLNFVDRLLVRVARVAGVPLLAKELSSKRFARLSDQLKAAAKRHHIPRPRDVFDDLWSAEARRVLTDLGLA